MAVTGEDPQAVCPQPERVEAILPDPALAEACVTWQSRYRAHYAGIAGPTG